MASSTDFAQNRIASAQAAESASKPVCKPTAQHPWNPISAWLDQANAGNLRMLTDAQNREWVEQRLLRTTSQPPR
jgi:hypothetical protein